MKTLMLSWEYPPEHVGGLGRHVGHLSEALADLGCDVHVIAPGKSDGARREKTGLMVHSAQAYSVPAPDFSSWVLQLNLAMLQRAITVLKDHGPFDIVHAHDWLVAFSARAIKHAFGLPLVATIHATESGRNRGIHSRQQAYVSDIEWWLCYEAWRLICCSEYMKSEIKTLFGVPQDKMHVISNGVIPEEFVADELRRSHNRYVEPGQSLVFFVGRLVREKGVHVLIEAIRVLTDAGRNIKLVVAGTGPYEEDLKYLSASLGVYSKIHFAGRISDDERNRLYRWADAAVVPSLYEPFGIVALEAMSAGTGLIVSDTGGLSEVVSHEKDGLKVKPDDPTALAYAISRLLDDRALRTQIGKRGPETVAKRYLWSGIAEQTRDVYRTVLEQSNTRPHTDRAAVAGG